MRDRTYSHCATAQPNFVRAAPDQLVMQSSSLPVRAHLALILITLPKKTHRAALLCVRIYIGMRAGPVGTALAAHAHAGYGAWAARACKHWLGLIKTGSATHACVRVGHDRVVVIGIARTCSFLACNPVRVIKNVHTRVYSAADACMPSTDNAAAPTLACHRLGGDADAYSGYRSAPGQPGDPGVYVVPAPVDANTDPYSGYAALPAGSMSMLAPTTAGAPSGPPGWQAPPQFDAEGLPANEGAYSGYAALPTLAAVGLAGAQHVLTPEIYDGAPGCAPDPAGVAVNIANEGAYSGYATLPTPAVVGLAGAERVLTPEIYDGFPGGAPDYASGPLPFGGVSPRIGCPLCPLRRMHVCQLCGSSVQTLMITTQHTCIHAHGCGPVRGGIAPRQVLGMPVRLRVLPLYWRVAAVACTPSPLVLAPSTRMLIMARR